MKTVLALLLFISTPTFADEWTSVDTKREVAFQTLWAIDFAQTRNIAEHPDRWHEENSYLGLHPTIGAVNRYFLAGSILHIGVSNLLNEKYRKPFQYGTIAIEVGIVHRNRMLGISARF